MGHFTYETHHIGAITEGGTPTTGPFVDVLPPTSWCRPDPWVALRSYEDYEPEELTQTVSEIDDEDSEELRNAITELSET